VLAFVANENRELRDAESSKGSTWRRSITCMASRSSTRCADPEAASPTDRPVPPPNLSRVGTIVDSIRPRGRPRIPGRYAPTEDGAATIHVAQPLEERDAVANAVALKLLAPGAALLAVLALTIGWTVRAAAEPLIRYSRDLDRLAPAQSKPVDSTRLPDELQPVARAIDRLLVGSATPCCTNGR